jgi:uridine phosphorylase
VSKAAELLEDPVWSGKERGLTTVSGGYRGHRITVAAFGMGAPVAAVVLHELATLGVRTFLRLGTAIAIGPTRLGDLVLAEGAVRNESTSATYLPLNYPAVADHELAAALRARLTDSPRGWISGLLASYDGFYTEMFAVEPDRESVVADRLGELVRYGVRAVDMETSAVLIAARALGARAGSLCLATVDGLSRSRLDTETRTHAERELLRTGLTSLTDL